MKCRRVAILFGLILMVQGCAAPGTVTRKAAETDRDLAEVDYDDPDKVTCKTVVRTGTRLGTRVCKTNREWLADRERAREATEDIQRRGVLTGNPQG